MQRKILYVTRTSEIIKELGITENECWKFFSLDDWDYALIVDGKKPRDDYHFDELLQGCCDNEWVYIKKLNKTIGLAYHS